MKEEKKEVVFSPFISEFIGTAVLIGVGLSFVILNFGNGSPLIKIIPDAGIRRALTGFLFGTTGGLIALSPVGKYSGAHINPAVTLAFWLRGKQQGKYALGYVIAQVLGGAAGAVPLLLWGKTGKSIYFGASLPGQHYGELPAVLGEIITTFALVAGLFLFLGHKRLRPFTPALFPFLYAIMVFLEAPVSGTSTNPARSFGPEVVSGNWHYWWVYWAGPAAGAMFAILLFKLNLFKKLEFEVAKVYHFEHDPHRIFRKI